MNLADRCAAAVALATRMKAEFEGILAGMDEASAANDAARACCRRTIAQADDMLERYAASDAATTVFAADLEAYQAKVGAP